MDYDSDVGGASKRVLCKAWRVALDAGQQRIMLLRTIGMVLECEKAISDRSKCKRSYLEGTTDCSPDERFMDDMFIMGRFKFYRMTDSLHFREAVQIRKSAETK